VRAQITQMGHAEARIRTDYARSRLRPHHPRRRERQRAVAQANREQFDAAMHDAPAGRRHRLPGQRMKRVVDRLFGRQKSGAMSLP